MDNNNLSSKINSPPLTSTPAIQLSSSFTNVTFNRKLNKTSFHIRDRKRTEPTFSKLNRTRIEKVRLIYVSIRYFLCIILASSVQQSLGILLNPIFSPLVQSSIPTEQQNFSTNKRRYTESSNESSSSKCQYISSDVTNGFSNQIVTNNSKSQISTCHLCGKKFQSNDYLQLHLMNKHQIKTDLQRTTKLSNLIKTSNDSLNNNTIKKIKLEPNETTTTTITNVIKASSPINTIPSPNPSTVVPGIVDTYFAAKMADRVSCDICHKVKSSRF
jgi:hypothetical protein